MKLNIVTAASNSVGNAILKKIANPEDITLGLSRRGCDLSNVMDVRVSDLSIKDKTREELEKVLSSLDWEKIKEIKIFHNCCLAKYEFPLEILEKYPIPEEYKEKIVCHDFDGDGIDDGAYHALISTFDNVFSAVASFAKDKNISIGTICSLTDKKKLYSETQKKIISPSIFSSMIKSNRILRNKIEQMAKENEKIQSVCISAATVKTDTEDSFRKYSLDKDFWVTGEMIAEVLSEKMATFENSYEDIDLFVPHPERERISKETDEELTARQVFDITGIK